MKSKKNFSLGLMIVASMIAWGVSTVNSPNLLAKTKTHSADSIVNVEVVAVEIAGTKFWFPSSIFAKKGDTVRIHAVSKVPGNGNVHGYAIEAFKVSEVIDEKGKTFEFVANQAGIFPIKCQLHPAHVGGQLVVLD